MIRPARPVTRRVRTGLVCLTLGLTFIAAITGSRAADAQSGDPVVSESADLLPGDPTGDWDSSDFVWPISGTAVPDGPQASPFGPRLHASQAFVYDFHRGIDLQAPVGSAVRAVHAGRIASAGTTPGFADQIIELVVEAPDRPTLHVFYSHLAGVSVNVGDQVTQGQVLGSSGVSVSGLEHLHFEIRRGGRFQANAINPMTYLPFADSNSHQLAIAALRPSGTPGRSDVVVTLQSPFQELDFDGLTLELRTERDAGSPVPSPEAAPDLSAWSFGLGELNAANTPFVNGSSDLSILDSRVVALSDDRTVWASIDPGRYDGKTPPWDRASYGITFFDVPIADVSTAPWHLAVVLHDARGNRLIAWHASRAGVGTARCNGLVATVNLGLGQLPTPQSDVIIGTPGDDLIAGMDGDDVICGGGGHDQIFGQGGNDLIIAGAGDDRVRGGAGDDEIYGGVGADDLNGGSGNDQVFGEEGDDAVVRGGTGDDVIDAGPGADALVAGNGGADRVSGGAGDDKVTGGPRPDVVAGGPGNDEVKGHKGADQLFGDEGNDVLIGGPQSDTLDGGEGTDDCNGGTTIVDAGEPAAVESDTAFACEATTSIP